MKLPPRLELPIDIGGLLVALIVDITLNVICFATLAPDMVTRVAFVAIGVMIVLFVPRSWSKRQFAAWAVFASVVFFFDYSFTLVATSAQAEHANVNIYQDAEVLRIESDTVKREESISRLQDQYDKAAKRETMDQIKDMIDDERDAIKINNTDRAKRLAELKRESETNSGITSDKLFSAIIDAVRTGRITELIIFGLIFIGLQLIMASSIDNKIARSIKPSKSDQSNAAYTTAQATARAPAPSVEISPDDVDNFVQWTWFRYDSQTDEHAVPKEPVLSYLEKKHTPMDDAVYDAINNAAHELGIIDAENKICVDKNKSASMLKEIICV